MCNLTLSYNSMKYKNGYGILEYCQPFACTENDTDYTPKKFTDQQ